MSSLDRQPARFGNRLETPGGEEAVCLDLFGGLCLGDSGAAFP